MKFTKIYVEANEEIIKIILKLAKNKLGDGVNVINLNPELLEED